MKTLNPASKKVLALATAGLFFLTACFKNDTSPATADDSGDMVAMIDGRVQGDAALAKGSAAGLGISGATVTAMRLKSDGSLEAVSAIEVKTDVNGHFSLKAPVDTLRDIVIVAKKDAKEWRAVVNAKVKKGETAVCRPVGTESSVETDVFVKTRGGAKASMVSFADVASHIDGEMAMKASGKADVEGYLAAQLQTEADTRASVLMSSSGKFTLAQLDKIDVARMDAEAKLDAALDADASAQADGDFHQAEFKAFTDGGIAIGEFAKAREAAFHAMVQAGETATVDAEAKLTWLRKAALQHAITLQAAVESDVKASGGNTDVTVTAGATLKTSLSAAGSAAEVDSAFAKFRASVASDLKTFLTTTLGSKVLLSDSSKARVELKASLQAATTSQQVADAYAKFYDSAAVEIKGNITVTLGTADSAKIAALTRAALLIGIQGSVGGTGAAGFTLNGQVEGVVSGADVQLATLKSDGTLQIIATPKAQTDVNGNFTLSSDVKIPDSVIIVVTKDSSTLMTMVDSASKASIKVGTETTAETQVVQQTIKDGLTTVITPSEVKTQVDSAVAVDIKGNDSAIAALIGGLEIAAQAQGKFVSDSGFGLSASGIILINNSRASASTRLQADLKAAAGSLDSVRNAYDTYHKALLDAYLQAGLDAATFARSQEVYAQALARFSTGLTAEAKLSLIRGAHAQAARGLRAAAEAQAKASGAAEVGVKGLADAGVAFQASIETAANAEAIGAAYASYHAAVVATVKGAMVLQAAAIDAIDAKVNAADGARAQLMGKIKNGTDAAAVAQAQVDFAAQVDAQVKAGITSGLTGPTPAQIKAVSQTLILANMGG